MDNHKNRGKKVKSGSAPVSKEQPPCPPTSNSAWQPPCLLGFGFASLFTLVQPSMKRATQGLPKCLTGTMQDVKAVCLCTRPSAVKAVTFCNLWCVLEHSLLAPTVIHRPSHLTCGSKEGGNHCWALSFSMWLPAETPPGKHPVTQQLAGQH